MEIRVVDFDVLTKNYTKYQDGIVTLAKLRNSFIERMDPIKAEMESIVNAANSGLILDRKSQEEKNAKFNDLQNEAMSIDNEYKMTMKKEQDQLNKETYEELSTLINEYVSDKDIDLVIGKMEVVFSKDNAEITDAIIDLLKQKNMFKDIDEPVVEKNIVVEDLR